MDNQYPKRQRMASKNVTDKQLVPKEVEKATSFGDELGGTEIVDIFVGPQQKHFKVHKKLLCKKVPYFHKMFLGGFKEAIEHTARLPDDDPDVFDLFLDWLYRGDLHPADMSKQPPASSPVPKLIELYGFAEKICMNDLIDYTMTSIITRSRHDKVMPRLSSIKLAYQVTSPGSPLRSWISRCYLYSLLNGSTTTHAATLDGFSNAMSSSNDLQKDVLRLIYFGDAKTRASKAPVYENPCLYHMHGKGEICPCGKEAQ
ncbi:hypothetical protein EG329_007111 [Mollisiaceae sp. DMI_Dod_QoI]|nr:hypothetical protein EG329_007111 [Helotiales sp. DMI_Dod_QoI]